MGSHIQARESDMCTSYESTPGERFEAFSIFSRPNFEYKREIYKDYSAPIIRREGDKLSTDSATFGMVPRKHIPEGVKVFDTMNARSETVGQKRSFRSAWNGLQLCLIPCERFYEPCYETGKAVRWRIGLESREPLTIAGLWRAWKDIDGTEQFSFAMLTVEAGEHPLMRHFHRPDAEKRSVVIVPQDRHEGFLGSLSTDEARSFLQAYPADQMFAEPFPLPPRTKTKEGKPQQAQASLLADG
jgi:putative SOS response-associated peptidase YedK